MFGSKPGAYGAGLQAMMDEGGWSNRGDLADVYLDWGGFAYGSGTEGEGARGDFAARLRDTDLVAQAQDNREHDILDSDDYYQFMGGPLGAIASKAVNLLGAGSLLRHGVQAQKHQAEEEAQSTEDRCPPDGL